MFEAAMLLSPCLGESVSSDLQHLYVALDNASACAMPFNPLVSTLALQCKQQMQYFVTSTFNSLGILAAMSSTACCHVAGAQIPLEDVPSVQKEIVMRCRQQGKPVIVASHLLQSMIEYPTPTRAEVADISDVVRQRADALMLSGESAAGAYPDKAVAVLRAVSGRIEEWCRSVFPAP